MIATLFLIAALTAGIAGSQTIGTSRFTCDVANTSYETVLTARVKGVDDPVRLQIIWPTGMVATANFRNIADKKDRIVSSHLIGKTTVTRTILASAEADCILIHVIADQPGVVSFQARFLSDVPTQIQNRRELMLPGGKVHAHAWIIPFESEVGDDGKSMISVKSEGEALILLNLSENPEKRPIANTWIRLGERHDPGHTPPDPHLVWEAVKKTQDPETQDTRKE